MILPLTLLATLIPAPAQEDARALLLRVVENQERNQELQRQYTYVETVRTEDSRKDGTARRREEETFEVTPAPGGEYRRLIARYGQPLTQNEVKKEEEKFQKYIEESLKLSPTELEDKNQNLKRRVGRFESGSAKPWRSSSFPPYPMRISVVGGSEFSSFRLFLVTSRTRGPRSSFTEPKGPFG